MPVVVPVVAAAPPPPPPFILAALLKSTGSLVLTTYVGNDKQNSEDVYPDNKDGPPGGGALGMKPFKDDDKNMWGVWEFFTRETEVFSYHFNEADTTMV